MSFVFPWRKHIGLTGLGPAVLLALGLGASPSSAQGKLEAHYTAYLAGIPIGTGNWSVDIGQNQFKAAASGRTTGLLHVFTGGEGTSATSGSLNAAGFPSSVYAAMIKTRKKTDQVRLLIAAGNVKETKVEPETDKDSERIAITDAHRQGVVDPMAASLMPVPGNGNPVSPDACKRTVPVFDGRYRYDLKLAYKRMGSVKASDGYEGPVVVCSVQFVPISGYIPSRSVIKYLMKVRDVEVWLAPIAGTRVLVPFRAQGPTPVGTAVVEATQFVSTPGPSRASVTPNKKAQRASLPLAQ